MAEYLLVGSIVSSVSVPVVNLPAESTLEIAFLLVLMLWGYREHRKYAVKPSRVPKSNTKTDKTGVP